MIYCIENRWVYDVSVFIRFDETCNVDRVGFFLWLTLWRISASHDFHTKIIIIIKMEKEKIGLSRKFIGQQSCKSEKNEHFFFCVRFVPFFFTHIGLLTVPICQRMVFSEHSTRARNLWMYKRCTTHLLWHSSNIQKSPISLLMLCFPFRTAHAFIRLLYPNTDDGIISYINTDLSVYRIRMEKNACTHTHTQTWNIFK